jgi:hypothetical protein
MRAGGPALAWPRRYRAGSIDLSLHLLRAEKGEHILIIIPTFTDSTQSVDTLEGALADLYRVSEPHVPGGKSNDMILQAGVPLLRSQVDEIGTITFQAVPAGEYVLIVHVPESDLIIEELIITQD